MYRILWQLVLTPRSLLSSRYEPVEVVPKKSAGSRSSFLALRTADQLLAVLLDAVDLSPSDFVDCRFKTMASAFHQSYRTPIARIRGTLKMSSPSRSTLTSRKACFAAKSGNTSACIFFQNKYAAGRRTLDEAALQSFA